MRGPPLSAGIVGSVAGVLLVVLGFATVSRPTPAATWSGWGLALAGFVLLGASLVLVASHGRLRGA